ncbi:MULTISPECIES: hypothetical protein [unclassified Streptomyces]|nr:MULTISPECIES: hypothetical protein [unclassified Streptomyces]
MFTIEMAYARMREMQAAANRSHGKQPAATERPARGRHAAPRKKR